jgi:hypothetical protein
MKKDDTRSVNGETINTYKLLVGKLLTGGLGTHRNSLKDNIVLHFEEADGHFASCNQLA